MSILVTRGRKRKMEASHIGGDNIAVTNRPSPKRAHSSSSLPGSASGDSLVEYHQICGFVTDENARNSGEFIKQPCMLGDLWQEKYPLPLSSITPRKIRTGNKRFDAILPHIEASGYRSLLKLAQGKFGPVILAQHIGAKSKEDRECRAVAIKFIKRGSSDVSENSLLSRASESVSLETPDEVSIHQQLEHDNVVSVLDSVKLDGLIGLVLEYCAHGNLEQLLTMKAAKLLTEPVARHYFIQLHSSLQYLHAQGIAHLDVCLQNILVAQGNKIKLSDFGDARQCSIGSLMMAESVGTAGYQAPEIIRKVPYNPRLADIWSLGIVLYTITTGKLPYGVDIKDMLTKMEKEVPFPDERTVPLSRAIKEVLRGLLAYAPECRYTLNRTRNADFYQESTTTVQIGNFYIVQKPRKVRESSQGADIKQKYQI